MHIHVIKNEAETYFASWGDQVIGCVSILRRSFKYSELIMLWVDDHYRRRYIATKLLEKGVALAREMGTSNLFLQTHPKLVAANSLFQNQGFVNSDKYPASTLEYQSMTILLTMELN